MTKIVFSENDEDWWFDPETGEYEYEGSPLIEVMLAYMNEYEEIQTGNIQGVDQHPGEMWEDLSPEERKEKVLNYLTNIDRIDIHE